MYTPKITVITVVFNGADTIKLTIESVLAQTYPHTEYVIIDGKSTDRTIEVINKYIDRVKLIVKPDKTVYEGFNNGLVEATGDYIMYLGADDILYDKFVLERYVGLLNKNRLRDKLYLYGEMELVTEEGKLIERTKADWKEQRKTFAGAMNITHSGSLHHKDMFKLCGNFNETFRIAGDFELLLRLYTKRPEAIQSLSDFISIKMTDGGLSGRLENRLKVVLETKKARKLNNIKGFSSKLFLWELRVRGYLMLNKILGTEGADKLANFYRGLLGKRKRW